MTKEQTNQTQVMLLKNSLVMKILMLAMVLCVLATSVFAWFASNQEANSTGMQISVNNKNLAIMDRIVAVRVLEGRDNLVFVYARDTDGVYYQWSDTANSGQGAFVTETVTVDGVTEQRRIPISLAGLLPGEYVELQLWYRLVNDDSDFVYNLGIKDIICTKDSDNDWEREGFFIIPDVNDETLGDGLTETRYSALGVFKFSWAIGEAPANGTEPTFAQSQDSLVNSVWLSEYNFEESLFTNALSSVLLTGDTGRTWGSTYTYTPANMPISDTFYDGTGTPPQYASVKFRLSLDLTQYRAANIYQANVLSEFIVDIGTLFVHEWVQP